MTNGRFPFVSILPRTWPGLCGVVDPIRGGIWVGLQWGVLLRVDAGRYPAILEL